MLSRLPRAAAAGRWPSPSCSRPSGWSSWLGREKGLSSLTPHLPCLHRRLSCSCFGRARSPASRRATSCSLCLFWPLLIGVAVARVVRARSAPVALAVVAAVAAIVVSAPAGGIREPRDWANDVLGGGPARTALGGEDALAAPTAWLEETVRPGTVLFPYSAVYLSALPATRHAVSLPYAQTPTLLLVPRADRHPGSEPRRFGSDRCHDARQPAARLASGLGPRRSASADGSCCEERDPTPMVTLSSWPRTGRSRPSATRPRASARMSSAGTSPRPCPSSAARSARSGSPALQVPRLAPAAETEAARELKPEGAAPRQGRARRTEA